MDDYKRAGSDRGKNFGRKFRKIDYKASARAELKEATKKDTMETLNEKTLPLTHPFHAVKQLIIDPAHYVFLHIYQYVSQEPVEKRSPSYSQIQEATPYSKDRLNFSEFQDREIIPIQWGNFTPEIVAAVFAKAQELGGDVVIDSRVSSNEDPDDFDIFIPMVDFITARRRELLRFNRIEQFEDLGISTSNFNFYDSGASYHAYGFRLFPKHKIEDFVGALLLLDLETERPIIDHRWLGHSLRRGCFCLRWTSNQSRYKKVPTHISGI